jgi:hypothetical protein
VPVDGEQHGAEHDFVIAVKLMANGHYQVLGGPSRVLATPGRDGSSRPGQIRWTVFPEPHSWPSRPAPNSAAGFIRTPPRYRVPTWRIQFTGSGLSGDSDTWEQKGAFGNTGSCSRICQGTRRYVP